MNELFDFFKTALDFPYPYSKETRYNYNAFYEIMMELNWVPEKEVRIIHDSLPALEEEMMGHHYLDVLNLIDVEWERFTEHADSTREYVKKHPEKFIRFDNVPAWYDFPPKIFNVYFRQQDESYVKQLLSAYSWDYRVCMSFDDGGININYVKRYCHACLNSETNLSHR